MTKAVQGDPQVLAALNAPEAFILAIVRVGGGTAGGGSGVDQNSSASNASKAQDGEFAHAAEAIRQSIQNNPDIANLSHQVMLEQTPQGLRIQLVDQDGRPMFQQGSNEPMPYTKKLLAAVDAVHPRRLLAQPFKRSNRVAT